MESLHCYGAQDCLALSVQESIKEGPEVGEMDSRTKKVLEMFEKTLRNLNL